MAAFRAFPDAAFRCKLWLNVKVCLAFIAEPENTKRIAVKSRKNISTVRAFPFSSGRAEIHVRTTACGAVGPFLHMGIHAVCPIDLTIFKAFKWETAVTIRADNIFSPGFDFYVRMAIITLDPFGYHLLTSDLMNLHLKSWTLQAARQSLLPHQA